MRVEITSAAFVAGYLKGETLPVDSMVFGRVEIGDESFALVRHMGGVYEGIHGASRVTLSASAVREAIRAHDVMVREAAIASRPGRYLVKRSDGRSVAVSVPVDEAR